MECLKQLFLLAVAAVSLLGMASPASALGLDYYGVEVNIQDDLSVNNQVVLDFDAPVNKLEYSLDFRVENLKYEADFDFAECTVRNSGTGSIIDCTFIGMTADKNKLTLNFDTKEVIQKIGDNFRFTVNYGIPLPIHSTFVLIRLPQKNILAGEANESFAPSYGQTLTDGRHIMVFWEQENLPSGENLQFSILFTRPAFSSEIFSLVIYTGAIFAVVAIILAAFWFRRQGGSKVEMMKSVLNRDEKRIIDILNEKGGKAGQKVLVRETDFSKAKVSRLVKALRDRGVVDIEPISGRENRVILSLGKDRRPPSESEAISAPGDQVPPTTEQI